MDILQKIEKLKKTIEETEQLVDEMISSLEVQNIKYQDKEGQLNSLKSEVRLNVEKIDEIIKDYNANS
jgi:endonuclease III-like uncharacterized protein